MAAAPHADPSHASGVPSGTLAFAFTDIEGSTTRWDRDPSAMRDAVRRHDSLVRAAIVAHGGYVFKTLGDAFCAAFARAADATHAMVDAQRALAANDFSAVGGLRVRAAVHVGTADERDGDYFGPSVNRAARLLAIGHGGQTLLSGVAADLVRDALPDGLTLRPLGRHHLKDLAIPERVFDVLAPPLADDFPPLRSPELRSNNLPHEATSFVGRTREIDEACELVARHGVVSMVGTGGIGKTRTSLRVAARLLDDFPDGVWFVELASLGTADFVTQAIARAANLTLASDGDERAHLARALASKRSLVILDNCEHLIEAVARVVSEIARHAPSARILVSSRQPLGVAGEATYRLGPLDVPATDDAPARDAARSPAVALFVERARAADRRFVLTDENVAAVVDICRRLDGIALAIELAAVRVRVLGPHELRRRLDERFRVLTGGSRDALPRQQTLRALIDWSFDLLDETERALFRRLGSFARDFTFEGAAFVAADDRLDEFAVFDVLASLVDKSLVLAEPHGDVTRYRLSESTRAYAREKLVAAGEDDGCRERHLAHFHERAEAAVADYARTTRVGPLEELFATELDDVRAAIDFALATTRLAALGGDLVAAFARPACTLALDREFASRVDHAVAVVPPDERATHSALERARAFCALSMGRKEIAFAAGSRAVAHARACKDAGLLARALITFATCAGLQLHVPEARAAINEAAALAGSSPLDELNALEARLHVEFAILDGTAAAATCLELRRRHRANGRADHTNTATLNYAEALHLLGETERAIVELRTIVSGVRAGTHLLLRLNVLLNLAGYLAARDDPDAADAAREVLRELEGYDPDGAFAAVAMEHLALALAHDDPARAATLAGYADATLGRERYERESTEAATVERLHTILAERLSQTDLAHTIACGARLTAEAAIALALDQPANAGDSAARYVDS